MFNGRTNNTFMHLRILVGLILLICLLLGIFKLYYHDRKQSGLDYIIGGPFSFSPSGDVIAFSVNSKPVFLRINDNNIKILKSNEMLSLLSISWRPHTSPPEALCITAGDYNSPQKSIISIAREDILLCVTTSTIPKDIIVVSPAWNPSGNIVAARITKYEQGSFQKACLGLSVDEGRSFTLTEIPYGRAVWASNNTIFLQKDNEIMRINVSGTQAIVERKEATNKAIHLGGSIAENAVYSIEEKLYIGGQLFYVGDHNIKHIYTSNPYIVIQIGNRIILLDDTGSVIKEIDIGKDENILGICYENTYIYIMSKQLIKRYNFVTNELNIIYSSAFTDVL